MKIQDLHDSSFKEIAKVNKLTLKDCVCLKNDECAYINNNNKILFKCQSKNTTRATFDASYNDFTGGLLFPESDTYKLHSRPSSPYKIYLDFAQINGVLTNTRWNEDNNKPSLPYYAFNVGTVSKTNQRIQQVWKGVAEDFAPFNVDITTEPVSSYHARCIITNSSSNQIFGNGNYSGIAYLSSWNVAKENTCWCFYPNSAYLRISTQGISHELGHVLGLLHQGTLTKSFYDGSGNWGPIMGAPYNQAISQWAYVPSGQTYTGTTTQPSRNQNDLAIINQKLPYIPDDYPNTIQLAASTTTITSKSINTYYGIISQSTDVDFFKIKSGPGVFSITGSVSTTNPNLNLQLTLYDSNYTEIKLGTKTNLNSVINHTSTINNIYYVKVNSVGGTHYTTYGSLGKYKMVFNLQPLVIISPDKEIVYKGQEIRFNIEYPINTTNTTNTTLYWKNVGDSVAGDFTQNINLGTVIVANNTAVIIFNVKEDNVVIPPNQKTIKIELYTTLQYTTKIAESIIVPLRSNEYTITPNKTSVIEGEQIIFNITGTTNRTLYWTKSGTTNAADFNPNISSGTVTIINNKASITLITKNDLDNTETQETIKIELFTDSLHTNKVVESTVNLNNNLVTIVPNKTVIFEGEVITFNIATAYLANTTKLYWKNVGASNASDFTNNAITGNVTVNANAASFSLTSIINPVYTTTTRKNIKIQLFTDETFLSKIAETDFIYLNKIKITPNKTSLNEGSSVIFTINTNNVANNTIIYWKNSGTSTTSAADFNPNISLGEITITNNIGTLTLNTRTDLLTEVRETIIIELHATALRNKAIGNSPIVYLNNL
jgi:hypothetical protein